MATPGAAKKGDDNPVPYGTEIHATRYQYGIALTPERVRDKSRAAKALKALCELGTVAGNHGRFLFDFSPDAVVFRLTNDPAPRLLYCFEAMEYGKTVSAPSLLNRLEAGSIKADELLLGVDDLKSDLAEQLRGKGVKVMGVMPAAQEVVRLINNKLGIEG